MLSGLSLASPEKSNQFNNHSDSIEELNFASEDLNNINLGSRLLKTSWVVYVDPLLSHETSTKEF